MQKIKIVLCKKFQVYQRSKGTENKEEENADEAVKWNKTKRQFAFDVAKL